DRVHKLIPGIDAYGIVINDKTRLKDLEIMNELKVPNFFSSITIKPYKQFEEIIPSLKGVFISNWQDARTSEFISLDGIKDYQGRSKFSKQILLSRWKDVNIPKNTE